MCLTTGVSFAIICVLCCSFFLLVIMFIKKKRPRQIKSIKRFLYLILLFIYLDCLYLLFGPASCCCFSVARTIVGTWPFFFSIGAEGGRRKGRLGAGRRAPIDGGAVGSSGLGLGAVAVTPHVELHGAPAESP